MNFRYDINGLRAIAMISVLLYHFSPQWLTGGFVGVDVFFVVSGFLMTSIIVKGINNHNFSLVGFYAARANRIIPPLAFLCLTLLALGWFFLIPMDYQLLAEHASASVVFLSNHIYWGESGYFDQVSHNKWLLHTWSLSVEWQFYLLYPLMLMVIHRFLPKAVLPWILLVGLIAAFFFALFASFKWPTAGYFLLPARAWEMMLGGVAFLFPIQISPRQQNVLVYIGLLMIGTAAVCFTPQLAWPGYAALLPVLGTYLIIIAKSSHNLLLNQHIIQALGRWSYSIYLWHWPLVVLNYKLVNEKIISHDLPIIGMFLSVVLGWLSYRFIERRNWIAVNSWRGWCNSSPMRMAALSLVCGLFIIQQEGAAKRVPEPLRMSKTAFHEKYYGGSVYPVNQLAYIPDPQQQQFDFALVGDSFADQYVSSLTQTNRTLLGIFDHGCLMFPNFSIWHFSQEDKMCSEMYSKMVSALAGNNKPILLAYAWDAYQDKITAKESGYPLQLSREDYLALLKKELNLTFSQLGERQYYLVGVPQRPQFDVFVCLSSQYLLGYQWHSECAHTQKRLQNWYINDFLAELAATNPQVIFINPNDALCENDNCLIRSAEQPIHSDADHLSIIGSSMVLQYILQKMG